MKIWSTRASRKLLTIMVNKMTEETKQEYNKEELKPKKDYRRSKDGNWIIIGEFIPYDIVHKNFLNKILGHKIEQEQEGSVNGDSSQS